MQEQRAQRQAKMAQKENLMTEGLVCCHYHWIVNYELRYVSSEEVKLQETLRLG